MSGFADHDFDRALTKSAPITYGPPPPESGLAVASLILSISGLFGLMFIGPLAGIITGHMALGKIKAANGALGGRTMAKIGMILGYIQVVLAVVATLVIVSMFVLVARTAMDTQTPPSSVTTKTATELPLNEDDVPPPRIRTSPSIKMANEMGRRDFALLTSAKVDVEEGDILAFYDSGSPTEDPEFALLTKTQLLYLKEGRMTKVDLKDVEAIKDDLQYTQAYMNGTPDSTSYRMEVMTKEGTKLRINLTPRGEGDPFYEAVKTAAAKANPKP